MKCKQCEIIEMSVLKAEGDKITFICPKCKSIEVIDKKDIKTS